MPVTKTVSPQEKSISQLNANDRKALAQMLTWQHKSLDECSRGELIDCVIHMTAQVASMQSRMERYTLPFYKRTYWSNRFYWRGDSWLGALNTVLAFVSNRVLVRKYVAGDAGMKTDGWMWRKGTDFPRSTNA